MNCPICFHNVPRNAPFCTYCGAGRDEMNEAEEDLEWMEEERLESQDPRNSLPMTRDDMYIKNNLRRNGNRGNRHA